MNQFNQDVAIEMINPEISQTLYNISQNYRNINSKLSEQHIMALGRRYSMIADSYIPISQIFDREPSSEEENRKINIYLNSLYINIFGSLDNLAWLVYFEKIYAHEKIDKRQISLFNDKFIQQCIQYRIDISDIKKTHKDWFLDLKLKRDPIAHQIPLYIPYRVITTEEERIKFKEIEKEGLVKLNNNDTHGWFESLLSSRKIGKFIPQIWLVDSEKETLTFIDFRTLINNDIRKLNIIVNLILEML